MKIMLVGIGGFGRTYLSLLWNPTLAHRCQLVGAVDAYPEKGEGYATLMEKKIPVYRDLSRALEELKQIDLVIICSPIHYHKEHVALCMEKGCRVLCEKPTAGCLEDALAMVALQKVYKRQIPIGFQWSFSHTMRRIKEDIMSNKYGRPLSLRSMTLLPRDRRYFARNWAGRIRDEEGRWIGDSIANNAASHQLHNMLYLLGELPHTSALPKQVTNELYRANPIETFDTITSRILTRDDIELLYIASHAGTGFMFREEYRFEKGVITMRGREDFIGMLHTGERINYGNPCTVSPQEHKLIQCIDALESGIDVCCDVHTAIAHSYYVDTLHKTPSVTVGEQYIREDIEKNRIYIEGLDEQLLACFETNKLLSQIDVPWAQPAKSIVIHYKGEEKDA